MHAIMTSQPRLQTGGCRKQEIVDAVRTCLRSRMADCTIEPVPPGEATEAVRQAREATGESRPAPAAPSPLQGKACKDAHAATPLRRLLSIQRTLSEPGKSGFLMTSKPDDPLGRPHDLEVGPLQSAAPVSCFALMEARLLAVCQDWRPVYIAVVSKSLIRQACVTASSSSSSSTSDHNLMGMQLSM